MPMKKLQNLLRRTFRLRRLRPGQREEDAVHAYAFVTCDT